MSRRVRVAAVIPVYNRRDLTLQCLRSMEKLVLDGIELNIFVVDDGSTDGTSESISQNFPYVTIVQGDGNLWYTGAINLGIATAMKSEPEYLLLMNDDQVYDQDALRLMVESAEHYSPCVVGGLLLSWEKPHSIFQVSPTWRTLWGGWRHWQQQTIWTVPESSWEVDLIVGNCMIVPADAVKRFGPMNEVLFPNSGDAEFTPRLKRNGFRLIIDPRVRVFCQPNEIPKSIALMSWKERYRYLWGDIRMKQNLRRRLYGWIHGGPDPFRGVIAFVIFFIRYLLGINLEGEYANRVTEAPLKETLRHRTIPKVEV